LLHVEENAKGYHCEVLLNIPHGDLAARGVLSLRCASFCLGLAAESLPNDGLTDGDGNSGNTNGEVFKV